MVTGSASSAMQLQLFNKDGVLVVVMSDDSAMLGSYPVEDGMRIHVSQPQRPSYKELHEVLVRLSVQ